MNERYIVLDVYLYVKDRLTSENICQPGNLAAEDGNLGIIPIVLHPATVHSVSKVKFNLPHNHAQVKKNVETMYIKMMEKLGNNVPLLHPVDDMQIEDKKLHKLLETQQEITEYLSKDEIALLSTEQQDSFSRKQELKGEIVELEGSIRKASQMIMSTELVSMRRVMRRLEMADKNDVPTLKGKVACSISACDEILVTELLFSGMFSDLDAQQIAALLSCLIYTDSKENIEGI